MHKMLVDVPTRLESKRLILRKYEDGDGKEFFAMLERNNNREVMKENVDEATSVKTEEEAEIRLRELVVGWVARDRFVLGIWLKPENIQVGQIWIEANKWEVPSFEIGWFLDAGHQGKGIATEAANRAIKFLFEELNAHKIIAITRDHNEQSYRLAERLGFTREGHLRECGYENGRRFGLLYYGMLREEFVS